MSICDFQSWIRGRARASSARDVGRSGGVEGGPTEMTTARSNSRLTIAAPYRVASSFLERPVVTHSGLHSILPGEDHVRPSGRRPVCAMVINMRVLVGIGAVALALVSAAGPASADESRVGAADDEPSNGLALLVPGIAIGVLGAVSLAGGLGYCAIRSIGPSSNNGLCYGGALGVGLGVVAVGLTLGIAGRLQRETYEEWKARHRQAARVLEQVAIMPLANGAALAWHTQF
jgi:hypothetical protein